MDVEKCNCGAIEMEVAENQYFDEAIHHRGTARCIPLTDVADYAQLAALRDECDRARNVIEQVVTDCTWAAKMHEFDLDGRGYKNFAERIGLSLRHLIESEEGQ